MVQPGDPHRSPGQPRGQPARQPGTGRTPRPGWPDQGGGHPPPPPRSGVGLVIGTVGGVIALLVVLAVGGWYLLRQEEKPPVANPTRVPGPSTSASPSESPSGKQPVDLDDEETDPTPLSASQMFPRTSFTATDGDTYRLAGTLKADACEGVGASKIRDLLRRHHCGDMVVGVYLDEDEKLFSGLMVIPLETRADADHAEDELDADKQEFVNALTYYCPADGEPGADQCKRKADNPAAWYGSFQAFHRYLLVSVTLYTDGRRTDDLDAVDDIAGDVATHVKEAMLRD